MHHYRPLARELSASFLSSLSLFRSLALSACLSCCRIGVSWLTSSDCQIKFIFDVCSLLHHQKKKEIWRPKTQRYEPQKSNKSPVVNLAQSDHTVLRHFIWAFTRGDRNHFSNHIPPSLHSSKHRKSAIDNLSYLRNPQGTTARGHISPSLSARALAHN